MRLRGLLLSPETNSQIFGSVSDQYARYRPTYPAALFEWLARVAPRRQRVWDCACGSGQASADLAGHFDEVWATDVSANQIALAMPRPRIRYQVAPAEDCGLPAASCDLVTVAQALHWFDFERFYAEARRVGRRDGILAVWTYAPPVLGVPELQARFADFYRDVVGSYWTPERVHVESAYRTLPFPFTRLAAPEFAVTLEWTLADVLGYVRSWSANVKYREAHGVGPEGLLASALEPEWGSSTTRIPISFALTVLAGKLHR
jgi:ubiquinone/menaquinone biosynthesis C-methylase UbiE